MKLTVHYPKGAHDEAEALLAFLQWQGLTSQTQVDKYEDWPLSFSHGIPKPVVRDHELPSSHEPAQKNIMNIVAVGYFECVDMIREKGLVRM